MANTWLPPESRGGERTRAAFFELSHRLSATRTPEEAARIIVGVASPGRRRRRPASSSE